MDPDPDCRFSTDHGENCQRKTKHVEESQYCEDLMSKEEVTGKRRSYVCSEEIQKETVNKF
jgi:hypothetical protein